MQETRFDEVRFETDDENRSCNISEGKNTVWRGRARESVQTSASLAIIYIH